MSVVAYPKSRGEVRTPAKLKSKHGFAIIEVLIAALIAAALALIIASEVKTLHTGTTTANRRSEITSVANTVNQVLSSADLCQSAFQGQIINPAPGAVSNVVLNNPTGVGALVQPQALDSGGLSIQTITLTSQGPLPGVANRYMTSLDITPGVSATNPSPGTPTQALHFNLIVTLDASNTIQSCWLELPATLGQCPSGQVLLGFNSDGTLNCVNPLAGMDLTCQPGYYLRGINAGVKDCQPLNVQCVNNTMYMYGIQYDPAAPNSISPLCAVVP